MIKQPIDAAQAKIGKIAGAPWRICSVTVLPDYCLSVTCNDGTIGTVDMSQLFSVKKLVFIQH